MAMDLYLDTANPIVFTPTNAVLVSGDQVVARIETIGDVTLEVNVDDNEALGSLTPSSFPSGFYRYLVLVNDVVADEGVANVRQSDFIE